jgi:hypothetical protein
MTTRTAERNSTPLGIGFPTNLNDHLDRLRTAPKHQGLVDDIGALVLFGTLQKAVAVGIIRECSRRFPTQEITDLDQALELLEWA